VITMPDRSGEDDDVLHVLFDAADDTEDHVILEVALRAGLLWLCRCASYNPAKFERCERCRTRHLDTREPRTPAAIKLAAVRDYLIRAHGDEDADTRFVDACRNGLCDTPAWAAAEDVLAGADHYGYARAWSIIAEEIIAVVETTASKAAAR
jgi:hypothetical protein